MEYSRRTRIFKVQPRARHLPIAFNGVGRYLQVSKTREGRPEKLRRKLAGDLDNIVLLAMRKEPPLRYSFVGQFSEDIRRHLEGLPVVARKATLSYRGAKFIRRNTIAVAAAAVISLILLVGIATTGMGGSRRSRRTRASTGGRSQS